MYDILVFLFENCQQAELAYDRERVARKLSLSGVCKEISIWCRSLSASACMVSGFRSAPFVVSPTARPRA